MKSLGLFGFAFVAGSFALWANVVAGATVSFQQIEEFNYPGAFATFAQGINDGGDIVGFYQPTSTTSQVGFVRYADGTFSGPITAPGEHVDYTIASAINNHRTIAGNYSVPGAVHSFFLTGGVFTIYDYPAENVTLTVVDGINDAGDFVGHYGKSDGTNGNFASIGGNLISISIPGSTYISPMDINNSGDVVGWYNTPETSSGFRLESNGNLRYPIRPAAGTATLCGTNNTESSVGQTYQLGVLHGLFYGGHNIFAIYDYPNTTLDQLTGINRLGLICGWGLDSDVSAVRSFIVKVSRSDQ